MTASSTAPATTTVATPSTARAAAFPLRTRFVDDQSAAEKILAVKGFDCFVRFGVVANFGETESAWLSRETIAQQRERIRLHTDFRK